MYRYREKFGGSTFRSTNKFNRNIEKIGKISRVTASVTTGKNGFIPGVTFHGENGTARFLGFSWGYNGTGPFGLFKVLVAAGFSEAFSKEVVYKNKWELTKGFKWEIYKIGKHEMKLSVA